MASGACDGRAGDLPIPGVSGDPDGAAGDAPPGECVPGVAGPEHPLRGTSATSPAPDGGARPWRWGPSSFPPLPGARPPAALLRPARPRRALTRVAPEKAPSGAVGRQDAAMGIRMLHRRRASARVHTTAAAGKGRAGPDATSSGRPLPALAPDAATPRLPGTPLQPLREAAVRLRPRGLTRLAGPGGLRRLGTGTARGCLALGLTALRRLSGPRAGRRLTVFVVSAAPGADRCGGR